MLSSMFWRTVLVTVLMESSTTAYSLPDHVPQHYAPATNLSRLASLAPQSSLPAPTGRLKYVVLGVGTQNYTCTSDDVNDTPGTTGAMATLYDIGSRLNLDDAAKSKIATIAGQALSSVPRPTEFDDYMKLHGYNHVLGRHFFTLRKQIATPVFALDRLAQIPYPEAQVSKIDSANAPESADPGLASEGAVPWLCLADGEGLSTGGIDTVYRLETAGGKAPATCRGQERSFEIQYAAQYWMFGPG